MGRSMPKRGKMRESVGSAVRGAGVARDGACHRGEAECDRMKRNGTLQYPPLMAKPSKAELR